MASIKKIEGKTGTSYKITVTKGRDSSGKQIRHFKTWTPDRPMTPRQMEKEVQRVALEFEKEIDLGFQADNRQTFDQYARYVIDLKEQQGQAKNSIAIYQKFMKMVSPIIGHMKISEVRPQHINALYKKIGVAGVCVYSTMEPKVDLTALMEEVAGDRKSFAKKIGIFPQTIYRVCSGKSVNREKAEKIAQGIGKPYKDLFKPVCRKRELSNTTIRRVHSFLSCVFAQAEKEMLIPYNPVSRATPPASVEHEPEYFQPDTLAHILEALEGEDIKHRAMVHLLAVTGCRRGEIAGLKWEKIDFTDRQIKIDTSLSYLSNIGVYEGQTKTRNTRFVAIPAETVLLLKQYRAWQAEQRLKMGDQWNDTGYVFTRENGLPVDPRSIASWLNGFSKRHGLPHINPHAFRHTAASILISEGVDIVTVSKMLGHANPTTTANIYSHIIEESKRKATECIADVMLRKKKA